MVGDDPAMASTRGRVAYLPYDRTAVVLLAMLLAIDTALILGDILHRHAVLADERFSVSRERGFGEMFEYTKLAVTAAVLAWSATRLRSWAIFFWAALFAYLLIDNAFAVHELMGEVIGGRLPLPRVGNVRPADFGELVFLGAVGAVAALGIAAILRWACLRARRLTWMLGAGLLALAGFGVGVDLVHRLVSGTWLEPTAAVVEDGGELIVTSALLWMVWQLSRPFPGWSR
jgi:hypothetical protein